MPAVARAVSADLVADDPAHRDDYAAPSIASYPASRR